MQGPSSTTLNMNNPGVRRLMKEYRELQKEGSDQYKAAPLDVCITDFLRNFCAY